MRKSNIQFAAVDAKQRVAEFTAKKVWEDASREAQRAKGVEAIRAAIKAADAAEAKYNAVVRERATPGDMFPQFKRS